MKRFLTIFILSILFTSNAYAKIDKSYVKQIYEGCISDAKQNNDYNSNSKKFCKCYANQFNIKFNNDQLIEFLSKSDQAKAQIVETQLAPPCYSASSNSTSSGKLITLKDCMSKSQKKKIEEWYYEVDINNRIVIETKVYSDAEIKRLDEVAPGGGWSKFEIKKYPIVNSTSRIIETGISTKGFLKKALKIDLKKGLVESHMSFTTNADLDLRTPPPKQCTIVK